MPVAFLLLYADNAEIAAEGSTHTLTLNLTLALALTLTLTLTPTLTLTLRRALTWKRKRRSGEAPAPRSSSALPSSSVAAVPMMPSCSVISRAYTHAPGGLGRWHRYSSRSRHSPE